MEPPRARELAEARWYPRPGVERAALAGLLERAEAALESGAVERRSSRRKRLHALGLESSAPDHLLKTNDYRGIPWPRRLRRSKSRAELTRALAVAARGVPTPLPLAAGELRRHGLLERCFLLMPLVPGAVDLEQLHACPGGEPRARRALASELGALARRMHDAGVFQEDFAPNNFLWRAMPTPTLWAIDFERTRLRAPLSHADRRFLLAKLDRRLADASAAARMRFLRAYSAGDRAAARGWWRELEAQAPRLARRDCARLERTATRASRRFAPFERGDWQGWVRRDADPAALVALCESAREGRAPDGYLVRPLGALSGRQAARAWALAQLLFQRAGASPRPLALLRTRAAAAIAFERPPGCEPLDTVADRRPLEARLALALDRLLVLGARAESLTADRLAVAPRGRGVWLLDPLVLEPERPPAPDLHRLARACAARLTRQ